MVVAFDAVGRGREEQGKDRFLKKAAQKLLLY
jgi:hypothetical protein